MNRPLLFALLLVGASQVSLAHGASAPGEHFRFTVPVTVKQFTGGPLVVLFRVGDGPNSLNIGGGEAPVPLDGATGDFSGNVVVKISQVQGDPSKASFYRCELRVIDDRGRVGTITPQQAKSGSPFTASVSGPITK